MSTYVAAVGELGELQAEYRGKHPKVRVVLSIFLLLVGGAVMPLGLIDGSARALQSFATCGLCIWLGAAFLAFAAYMAFSTKISVYAHGFIHTRLAQTRVFRWDEIDAITQRISIGSGHRRREWLTPGPDLAVYSYGIRKTNGAIVTLTNAIDRVWELGPHIQQKVLTYQLPRALETVKNGGTLAFGQLHIDQAGISKGGETLYWYELADMEFNQRDLQIFKGSQLNRQLWLNTELATIPNHLLFCELVRRNSGVSLGIG